MRNNCILTLLFITISLSYMHGQSSVLFVDDSDDSYSNAELFYAALDSVGYPATYFNAVDSAAGPTDLYMNNFDLVIWHCSSDGSELLLWNGLDEDNASIKSYLNGGGRLWLVGNDFLYDRYGIAPVNFSTGDFTYDYLGISSYDLQSYVDDGELGVPIMTPDANATIPGLNDLTWQFTTLWYADGVSLTDDATPVYRMGDENYVFHDSIAASFHDNGTFQVLSYFFDISLVSNFELLKENVLPVMTFFDGLISSNQNITLENLDAKLFPNPSAGNINLELELKKSSDVSVSLMDLNGNEIMELMPLRKIGTGNKVYQFCLASSIPNGYYLVKITMNDQPIYKAFILQD